MLGLSGVPALIQLLCMTCFFESPKWLIKMDRAEEAQQIFSMIFNVENNEGLAEMKAEIKQINDAMENEDPKASQYSKYKELFTIYRKIVFIGIMLQILQQLAGINTLMYYGPEVMKEAGFGSTENELDVIFQEVLIILIRIFLYIKTLYAAIPLSVINCVGTFIATLFVDNLGRRYIMLRTFPGCAFSMFLLGIGMWLTESNNEYGGWIAIIAVFIYLSFFSIGLGPTPWTVNSEIYPLHLRGIGNSMATLGNWTGNYVISAVFLSATETNLGKVFHLLIHFIYFFV